MIHYVYLGPQGQREQRDMGDEEAYRRVGQRVLIGFPVEQLYVEDRKGRTVLVIVFRSEISGDVWSVFYDVTADQEV